MRPHAPFGSDALAGLRILVVEDDADTLAVTSTLLEMNGATVLCAYRATAALEMIDTFQPDLLLSDLVMPEMSGAELMRRVRALPGWQSLPAVALTAHPGEGRLGGALAAGFGAALAKPVLPERLIDEIRKALRP